MKIAHPNGEHKIEIEDLDERITIDYKSTFDYSKHLEIGLSFAVTGNTIPTIILKIPDDYKLMKQKEDKGSHLSDISNDYYLITPNINTDGWEDIKRD